MPCLSSNLRCALVDGTPVFLDLAQGRYFLLRGELAQDFLAFRDGAASSCALAALDAAGILDLDGQRRIGDLDLSRTSTTSPLDTALPAPARLLVLVAAWQHRRQRNLLARRGLSAATALLGTVVASPVWRRLAGRSHAPTAIAAAFVAADRLVATSDQCLARSFAMAGLLRRLGHPARLVIGVRLPFAAHAWVECYGMVLSDPLDRVASLVPIAAL